MGTFAAVDILFPFVAALYIVVLVIFYIAFKRYENSLVADEFQAESALERLFSYDFRTCYQCICGDAWNKLLLVTRSLTFLYYFSVGLVYSLSLDLTGWNYFTNWNIYLLCFYFLCATLCSVIGVLKPEWTTVTDAPVSAVADPATTDGTRRSRPWLAVLNVATHVVFEVSGATALFVTVVNFTMLSADMTFWNMTQHLFTSAAYLLELTLNVLPVYMLHFPLNVTWAVVYIIFTWIVVGVGLRFWPYEFLRADNISCIVWYSALVVMNFIFYWVWYQLSILKFGLLSPVGREAVAVHTAVPQQDQTSEDTGFGAAVHRVSDPEAIDAVIHGAAVERVAGAGAELGLESHGAVAEELGLESHGPVADVQQLAAVPSYEAVLGDEAV
jgi:hypothetical protein